MTQNKYNRKYLRELYKDDSESYMYDDKRYNRDGEIEKYGFSMMETWNLDTSLVELLYERLMRYKTQTIVNLEFHTTWDDEELNGMTQLEVINYLIELCKDYLLDDDFITGGRDIKNKKIWKVWTVLFLQCDGNHNLILEVLT